jgi:hypothetical protein
VCIQREMDAAFVSFAFSSHELHTHMHIHCTIETTSKCQVSRGRKFDWIASLRFARTHLIWYTTQVHNNRSKFRCAEKAQESEKHTSTTGITLGGESNKIRRLLSPMALPDCFLRITQEFEQYHISSVCWNAKIQQMEYRNGSFTQNKAAFISTE